MKQCKYLLNVRQVQRLRAACDTETSRGKRDLAILDSMLFQGLRLNEVANLRMEDFRNVGGQLRLQLENRTDAIKIHDTYYRSLKTWLDHKSMPFDNSAGPVFVPVSTTVRKPQKPLRGKTISHLVAKYGNQAGLAPLKGPNRLKPSDLRRTCARTAYDHGADLLSLQVFLGFNHLETVARYIDILNLVDIDSSIDRINYKE
jgi:integrase/recombinase XerD